MSYSPNFINSSSPVPSLGASTDYVNGTGSTLSQGVPVSANGSGQLILTDVSMSSAANTWLGITTQSIASAATGQVATDGRLENIPLGLGFSVGNPIWVGLSGTLTNVQPDLTVSGWNTGYWILFVGVVVKNQYNPSLQDIQLMRQVIGQL